MTREQKARDIDGRSLLRIFAEARNEPESQRRRNLIERCCAQDVVFLEEGRASIGRHELEARFGRDDADPEHAVTIVAPVEVRDQRVWSRWELTGAHRTPITHAVIAQVNDAGMLHDVRSAAAPDEAPRSAWRRIWEAIAANPVAAVGLVGSATYAAIRIPTGVFYARLGTTPDEVGLGPQVLVPQSLVLLVAITVLAGAVYLVPASPIGVNFGVIKRFAQDKRLWRCAGAGLLIAFTWSLTAFMLALTAGLLLPEPNSRDVIAFVLSTMIIATVVSAYAPLLMPSARTARRELAAERLGRKDRWQFRRTVLVERLVGFAGAVFVLLMVAALLGGSSVINGGAAQGRLFPWRAIPAEVNKTDRALPAGLTSDCDGLRFLGTAGNQILVYDTQIDRLFRLSLTRVSVTTVANCLWVRVLARVGDRHCDGSQCRWDVNLLITASHDEARFHGTAYVRRCPKQRCQYVRAKTFDTEKPLQLRQGHYRLEIAARAGDQRAEQTAAVTTG